MTNDNVGFTNPMILDTSNITFIDSDSQVDKGVEDYHNPVIEDSEEDKEEVESKVDLKKEIEVDTTTIEEVNESPFKEFASSLVEEELLEDAPEDFDPEKEITPEIYQDLVKHNLKLYKEKAAQYEEVFENLSETTSMLIDYEANGGKDIKGFLQSLVYQEEITDLNPSKDSDAEKIVFEFYKSQGMESDRIRTKIEKLKDRGDLIDEATELKPELDKKAKAIAESKQKEQEQKAAFEKQIKTAYVNRVQDTIKTGKLDGVKIPKELGNYLTSVLTTDNVPVKLPNSTEVTVSYMEYLIKKHSYSKEGSIERLALAALLLERPEDFNKIYRREVETKETERFVREHKLSNLKKSGKVTEESSKPAQNVNALFKLVR